MNEQIALMMKWCEENYSKGADVMVECWEEEDFADLWVPLLDAHSSPYVISDADAWETLKSLASVYEDRQADAINSAF